MTITINGTTGIDGPNASGDTLINGVTVGTGAGDVSTNTAVGASALAANEAGGNNNTAVGYESLNANTTGDFNTAFGSGSLDANTTASNNTAVGYQAGYTGTTAGGNTYVGYQAGYSVATGNTYNTMLGLQAGQNTTSTYNTFVGTQAGQLVTSGGKNTIIGGYNGNQGGLDIRTSSNNIVISDGDGNPKLRCVNNGPDWTSGGTWITSNPTPVTAASVGSSAGTAAVWDGSGNLYKQSSSMRYKENIAEWTVTDAQLNAFVSLNPKLWDYTGKQSGCVGFIAEDIEALGLKNAYNTSPLINYSNEGEPDSNRDFALIALQHKVIQRLDAAIKEQQQMIEELKAKVAALEAK